MPKILTLDDLYGAQGKPPAPSLLSGPAKKPKLLTLTDLYPQAKPAPGPVNPALKGGGPVVGGKGGAAPAPAAKPMTMAADKPQGLIVAGNIDLTARPKVKNADGSISTVRSMSFNIDGNEVLIPTVSDDGRILSEQEALETYGRTKKHLGIFDTPQNATAYAETLHNQQDAYYNRPPSTAEKVGQNVAEFGKGIPTGAVELGGAAMRGAGAGAAGFTAKQIDVFDRIDRGEKVPEQDDPVGYQHMTPEQRQEVRGKVAAAVKPVTEQPIYKAGERVSEFGRGLLPPAPGYEQSPGRQLGEAAGSLAGGAVLSLINPYLAGGVFALAGAGEAVDRAVQAGATEEQIIQAAKLGNIPGLTDSLPLEVLLRRINIPLPALGKFMQAVARVGVQAATEALQEGGQQGLQNLIARETHTPGQSLTEGVLPGAAVGGGVGGLAEGLMQLIPGRQRGGQPQPVAQPAVSQEPRLPPAPPPGESPPPVDIAAREPPEAPPPAGPAAPIPPKKPKAPPPEQAASDVRASQEARELLASRNTDGRFNTQIAVLDRQIAEAQEDVGKKPGDETKKLAASLPVSGFVIDELDPDTGATVAQREFPKAKTQAQAADAFDALFPDESGPLRRGSVRPVTGPERPERPERPEIQEPTPTIQDAASTGETPRILTTEDLYGPSPAPVAEPVAVTAATPTPQPSPALPPVQPYRPRLSGLPATRDSRGQPRDLLSFVQAMGGIREESGELAAVLGGRTAPAYRRIVRRSGKQADYVREGLVQAGYLPEGSSVNDLYDAIDQNMRGQPVYAGADLSAVQERDARAAAEAESVRDQEAIAEVKALAARNGGRVSDDEAREAAILVRTGMDPEDAIGDVMDRGSLAWEAEQEQNQAKEPRRGRAIPFDAPGAPAARAADTAAGQEPAAGAAAGGPAAREQPAGGRPDAAEAGGQEPASGASDEAVGDLRAARPFDDRFLRPARPNQARDELRQFKQYQAAHGGQPADVARDYLLRMADLDGFEHIVVLGPDGEAIGAGTIGNPDRTWIPPHIGAPLRSPGSNTDIHHNHPGVQASLSPEDVAALAWPGLRRVYAYTSRHAFVAQLTERFRGVAAASASAQPRNRMALAKAIDAAAPAVQTAFQARFDSKQLSADDANLLATHIMMLAASRNGIIDYASTLPEDFVTRDPDGPAALEKATEAVKIEMARQFGRDLESRDGAPDRPADIRQPRPLEGNPPQPADRPGAERPGGAPGGSARPEGNRPAVERTEQGDQLVIPGAERITDRALAERKSEGKQQAKRPQKDTGDLPLFDTGARDQGTLFQRAFHGSPHTFDKFSTAYMGTGEGAQAFGWGLYFAGRRGVAEYYRKGLSDTQWVIDGKPYEAMLSKGASSTAGNYAANALWRFNGDKRAAIESLREGTLQAEVDAAEMLRKAESIEQRQGRLYEVDIPEDSELLDWDKPLSEQPEKVKAAIAKIPPRVWRSAGLDPDPRADYTGQELYNGIASWKLRWGLPFANESKAASLYLKSLGIPGHRFLDSGSRGKGEGSHNYVIYDDLRIETTALFQRTIFGPGLFGNSFAYTSPQVRDELLRSASTSIHTLWATAQTKFDLARIKAQDRMLALKRVQQAIEAARGEAIPTAANAYQGEELYHGIVGQKLDEFRTDHVEPLIKALAERGLTVEQLNDFLYARHAPERNAQIARINPEMPGGGSGMSDAEAGEIMGRFRSAGLHGRLEEVAAQVDRIIRDTRDTLTRGDLIDAETRIKWQNAYEHYVPLKGWESSTEEATGDVRDALSGQPRVGRGFDIRGQESKRALGRESKAGDILAHVLAQHEEAVVRAEKNKVAKQFVRLVEANPNEDLWKVGVETAERRIDKSTGLVTVGHNPNLVNQPNVLAAKIGGEVHYVTISDPGLAQAMKNLGVESMAGMTRALGAVMRVLARLNTQWNPAFTIPNLFRDVQTAMVNVQAEDVPDRGKLAGAIVRDIGKAARGAFGGERGKQDSEWQRYYREFAEAGGKISFFGLDSVETRAKKVRAMLADASRADAVGKTKAGTRQLVQLLSDINSAVENATRLSVYVNLRRRGVPKEKAASIARNLTVNFNRKGEWGSALNSLYLFYNAAVQGNYAMVRAVAKSRRVKGIVLSSMAIGALMDALMSALSPEDDETGEKLWDQIGEYDKAHNLIIINPWAKSKDELIAAKIPLPYGYNIFPYTGIKVGEILRRKPSATLPKAAIDIVAGAFDAFNPLGSSGPFWYLPTIAKPVAEIEANTTFSGSPMMPDKESFGQTKPDSELYFKSVRKPSLWVAREMNDLTGGSAYREGYVSWSPETLDHWFDFATGGLGRFLMAPVEEAMRLKRGDKTTAFDWPVVSRFTATKKDWYVGRRYHEIKDAVVGVRKTIEAAEGAKDRSTAREWRERFPIEVQVAPIFREAERKLTALYRGTGKDERDEVFDAKVRDIQAEAIKAYTEALEKQKR